MNKLATTFLMLGLSLSSIANSNTTECKAPGSLENGENVIYKVNSKWVDGKIVKERGSSNNYYIVENMRPDNNTKKYNTYVSNDSIQRRYGCNDSNGRVHVGDIAYVRIVRNNLLSYEKVEVEAMNNSGTKYIVSNINLTESTDENKNIPRQQISDSKVYGTSSCTTKTDDKVELCPGDYAVSFDRGEDVKVLGIKNGSILYELNGELLVSSSDKFIKTKMAEQDY